MADDPIQWLGDRLRILDQTKLPKEEVFIDLRDHRDVVEAIRELKVRGAPAIGVAAAYAVALEAGRIEAPDRGAYVARLTDVARALAASRPTAVNLFNALNRMTEAAKGDTVERIRESLVEEARRIHLDELQASERLSRLGAELIGDGCSVLTHCNAGRLATAGYGTALGVIRAAREQGKKVSVFATETRPLLQGARLTTWELSREGIPVTLITDSMAGYFMWHKRVDCVLVGADRIALNGDVANKIGTYALAVLAGENGLPFYVAAPVSTIDASLAVGSEIPIEERKAEEVTHFGGVSVAPDGIGVANPAFDVTPNRYISAIITEKGVVGPPYSGRLSTIVNPPCAS